MDHVRGAPYHPQTQGKIERWHQTMKNRVLLEHYFLPGDLERQVGAFVDYYNAQRYHESLGNLTPADVYYGRGDQILEQREETKRKTMLARRLRESSSLVATSPENHSRLSSSRDASEGVLYPRHFRGVALR